MEPWFDIVVFESEIMCVIRQPGFEPKGRRYAFPHWASRELEDACQSIAKTITELRLQGVDDFRFHKEDNVSLTNLNRIAERIAGITGAQATPVAKGLN